MANGEVMIEHLRTEEMFANNLAKPVHGAQIEKVSGRPHKVKDNFLNPLRLGCVGTSRFKVDRTEKP